jgi:hypothetical protein
MGRIEIKNETDLIEDLRMQGYILKKSEKGDTSIAVHRAYQAGKEAGRAEVLVEMLNRLKNERNMKQWWFVLSGDIDTNYVIAEYIIRYLPKRYKENYESWDWPQG